MRVPPISCGSMKSIGRLMALGSALAGILCGCAPYAPSNPLGASTASATSSPCNSVFSFEDGSLLNWSALPYGLGFKSMQIDGIHAFCGSKAMHLRMNLGGSKTVVVQTLFDSQLALSGVTRTMHVYFEQAPPAALRLQAVFLDQNLNWGTSVSKSSFAAGWNTLSGTVSMPQAAGFLMQFDTTSPVNWTGDVWIDEINW